MREDKIQLLKFGFVTFVVIVVCLAIASMSRNIVIRLLLG